MAQLIGSLFVSLTADFAPFQRNMRTAEGVVASTSSSMRRNVGLTEKTVASFQRTTSNQLRPYALIAAARTFDTVQQRANLLRGALFATTAAFGGLGAALTTNVISRYIDSFTGLENQMRVVATGSADLAANLSEVQAVAERSRSSLQAVGTLFARIQKASPEQGAAAILRRVETVNKALQLGGATAQESASAAIQFSQAIASNRLGGEELRAVLETPLGNELAKALGVTIGEFRKMGTEGKLTADVLFKALDKMSAGIDQKFAKSVSTIDQALTVADGKITMYAGSLDDAYGITKMMTGAIGSFGNNLETIVPLLALVGTGLGAVFGGRLLGGGAGRSYSAIATGIKAVSAARKEDLRIAREGVALAKREKAEASAKLASAKGVIGGRDFLSLAPKNELKAYQRDIAAVEKADASHLALMAKKAEVTQQLGEIYKTTSVGELKAAQALADQQMKLNNELDRQRDIKKQIRVADNAVTGGAAMSSQTRGTLKTQTDAQKALNDLKKQSAEIDRSVTSEQVRLAAARDNVLKTTNASYLKAAQDRANVIVAEKKLVQDLAASDQRRLELAGRARSTRGVADASGLAAATAGMTDAQRASLAAEAAVLRSSLAMQNAAKSASLLSTSLGVLRTGAASLVGFLGGPWGVAFTTAIAALAYFGSQARATAEEIARAQAIIDEVTSGAGGEGVVTINERIALSQKKIIAETERLAAVTKEAARQRNDLADAASLAATGLQTDDATFRRMTALIEKFREGKVSLQEFVTQLANAGVNVDVFKDLGVDLAKSENAADLATLAIKRLEGAIKSLKDAMLGPEFSQNIGVEDARFRDERRRSRAQYGAGQEAARAAMEQARRRRELLDAAGDTGDSARNTPAKIAAREQELLEQGYATTREAARALATEELNLAEAQRVANKEFKAGTTEAEKFSNKLKELQEQGEGAFLSDLDRKVLDVAKSLKDGSEMMAQYIAAIKSGDLSQAPPELLQARDALMQIGAAETWRGIIEKYGQGVQLAGQFADKQLELNYLVATGKITAQQSEQAWADFIGQFKEHEWIDQTADALATFANSAITDFENIGDAFKTLVKQLAQIALQAAVLDPFRAWIRGSLSSMVGGGATGAGSPAGISGVSGVGGIMGGLAQRTMESMTGAANDNFAAAGSTKTGIPLAKVQTQGLTAKVRAEYANRFQGLFDDLEKEGYKITSLGEGGYSYRKVAGSKNLSRHAYGEAVDINPRANPHSYKFQTDMPANVNDIAKRNGLTWGGTWNKPDTMHFQVDKSANMAAASLEKLAANSTSASSGISKVATSLTGGSAGGLGGLFGLGLSNTGTGFMDGRGGGLMGMLGGLGGGARAPSGGGGGIFGMLLSFLPMLFGGFAMGTDSARRGWAMVGERGPELMKFKGGEKVVPSHRSRRLPKGYRFPEGTMGGVGGKDAQQYEQAAEVRNAMKMGTIQIGRSTAFMASANQNVSSMARRNLGGGGSKVDINVNLDGATGNQEVHRIARSAVTEGLGAYQAQQVQGGVQQNQKKFSSLKG